MNFAYIDNQNLFMSTSKNATDPWTVDMRKLRVYLKDKYGVGKANLFVGIHEDKYRDLYSMFGSFGYEIAFREHSHTQVGKKKGNVDADIVFEMMMDAYASGMMDKAVLVSGDGDYKRVVTHLIGMGKFEKLLLPSRSGASSLYKRIPEKYKAYLDAPDVRRKIERI